MKNKHLIFDERIIIEEQLNKGASVHSIAKRLGRPDSSIVREIVRNRYLSHSPTRDICMQRHTGTCTIIGLCDDKCRRFSCSGCNCCDESHCYNYKPYFCKRLMRSPYVCNGCENIQNCRETTYSPRYKYMARRAQIVYEDKLKESRTGIDLTPEEMEKLDNLVSPLLLQGQSIRAIFMNHSDEIPCCESTLYEYVDRSYFTARNIDMPRKVRFKPRYDHGPRARSLQEFAAGRTYKDFTKYIEGHPDLNIWELDTVIGTPGGCSLMTLLFRKTNLMIAILLKEHTQEAVIEAINCISDAIGISEFQRLFQVILTDRGTEFSNPFAIECDRYGEIKTKLFYCDPYCSWQKGQIERNHEFIRMVLPKGKSFDSLSQSDIHLMMNHINNYPRESLNNVSPYDLSRLLLGDEFLKAMQFHKINVDDVILKPWLLRKPIVDKSDNE